MMVEHHVTSAEIGITVFGEIVSANGFDSAYPISVHLYFDLPKGWRKHQDNDTQSVSTHCSSLNHQGTAHFSHPFFHQFLFDPNCDQDIERFYRPHLLFSVVGTSGKLLHDEGFVTESLPVRAGNYVLNLCTWKPAPRNITDKMKDLFLGIGPSLQDPRAILSPPQHSRHLNLFGFETQPSGSITIRLRIVHETSSSGIHGKSAEDQLFLLERMSSSDKILESVQAVIDAFQRARKKAVATNIITN